MDTLHTLDELDKMMVKQAVARITKSMKTTGSKKEILVNDVTEECGGIRYFYTNNQGLEMNICVKETDKFWFINLVENTKRAYVKRRGTKTDKSEVESEEDSSSKLK
jgi:hypothetical protein